jgi:hypothetical protein
LVFCPWVQHELLEGGALANELAELSDRVIVDAVAVGGAIHSGDALANALMRSPDASGLACMHQAEVGQDPLFFRAQVSQEGLLKPLQGFPSLCGALHLDELR